MSICSPQCGANQICINGICNPLSSQCGSEYCVEGETCVLGNCLRNQCPLDCGTGAVCEPDLVTKTMRCREPCKNINCGKGYTCQLGENDVPLCIQTRPIVINPYYGTWNAIILIMIAATLIITMILIPSTYSPPDMPESTSNKVVYKYLAVFLTILFIALVIDLSLSKSGSGSS